MSSNTFQMPDLPDLGWHETTSPEIALPWTRMDSIAAVADTTHAVIWTHRNLSNSAALLVFDAAHGQPIGAWHLWITQPDSDEPVHLMTWPQRSADDSPIGEVRTIINAPGRRSTDGTGEPDPFLGQILARRR